MCYIKRKYPEPSNTERMQDATKLIIVEGSDDASFFTKILESLELPCNEYGIVIAGGVAMFEKVADQIVKNPRYRKNEISSILFIQDADSDGLKAEKSLQKTMMKAFQVEPENGKFKLSSHGVHIGIFILSNTGNTGALEDLCLDIASRSLPNYKHVETYMKSTCENQQEKFSNKKRWLQALLAAESNPLCNGAGRAIESKLFEINDPIFDPVKAVVKTIP
jgi:5S rRNA maturation endonuclease (ribonuclease M5)